MAANAVGGLPFSLVLVVVLVGPAATVPRPPVDVARLGASNAALFQSVCAPATLGRLSVARPPSQDGSQTYDGDRASENLESWHGPALD